MSELTVSDSAGPSAEETPDIKAKSVAPPAPEPPPAQLRPRNILRLLAWLIDGAIVAGIVVAVQGHAGWRRLDYWILPLLYLTVYHGLFVAFFGRTPGKAVLGLRVVRIGRRSRGILWSLGRAGLGYPFVDFLTIAAITVLFDGQRRAPHDFIFGSEVVYEPESQGFVAPLRRLQGLAKETVENVEGWKAPWILASAFVDLLVQLAKWLDSGIRAVRRWLAGSPPTAHVPPAPSLRPAVSAAVALVMSAGVLAGLMALPKPVVDPCSLVGGDHLVTAIREVNNSVNGRVTLRPARQEIQGTQMCIVPWPTASTGTGGQELSLYWLIAMTSRHPLWKEVRKADSVRLSGVGDEAYVCSLAVAGNCLDSKFVGGGGATVYARSGDHVVEVSLAGDERKAIGQAQELAREALQRWGTLGGQAS
jgi:uncharacterized RDD family membrane protein YckC